jgi:O-antigen/teichoic acid export membrane protein
VNTVVVECLRCGRERTLAVESAARPTIPECPNCGYLGWATPIALSDSERLTLRRVPPEARRRRQGSDSRSVVASPPDEEPFQDRFEPGAEDSQDGDQEDHPAGGLMRNTAALAGARVVTLLNNLVIGVFLSRQLGAAGLGIYSAALTYYAVLRSAGEGGSRLLLMREVAKDPASTSRYVSHLTVMAIGRAAVVIPAAWLIIPHVGFSGDLAGAMQVAILAFLAGAVFPIQEAVYIAYERSEFTLVGELVASLITTAVSLHLLWTGHGVLSVLLVFVAGRYALVFAHFGVIHYFVARLLSPLSLSFAVDLVKRVRAFAASSVVSELFGRSEVLLLSLLGTPVQIGYYSAATKLVDPWSIVPGALMPNVYTTLSRSFHRRDGRAQRIQDLSVKYLLALAIPLTVGTATLAAPLVSSVFGDGFSASVPVLRVYALSIPLYFANAVLWRVLAARGDEAAMLRAQLATILPRVVGGVALVWWFDELGAAIIANVALALHTILLARSVRADGTRLRFAGLTARFVVAATVMAVAIVPLVGSVSVWLLALLGAAVYGCAVLFLRAVPPDDIALLRTVIPFRVARS